MNIGINRQLIVPYLVDQKRLQLVNAFINGFRTIIDKQQEKKHF